MKMGGGRAGGQWDGWDYGLSRRFTSWAAF